jgi:hypothetical protein
MPGQAYHSLYWYIMVYAGIYKGSRERRWRRRRLSGQDVVLRGVESMSDQVHSTPCRRKVEVEYVREASQRRLASHTHKHDPETHGDHPRRLINQPKLTSKPYWARLKP